MDSVIQDLSQEQVELNKQITALTTKVRKDIEDFERGSLEEDSDLRAEIRQTLDDLDTGLSRRYKT